MTAFAIIFGCYIISTTIENGFEALAKAIRKQDENSEDNKT